MPEQIEIRGAWVHNLKNTDADIPLEKVAGICGVSGSGKSSLALGVRYAGHRCPNGHYLEPSLLAAAGKKLRCPICGVRFYAPSAEKPAVHSQGACPACDGVGTVRGVKMASLICWATATR